MEPFDLERAKAGDPIGIICATEADVRFLGESPDGEFYAVYMKPRNQLEWFIGSYKADGLFMKPKPIRFWVRPWKYDGRSGATGLVWWDGEWEQPSGLWNWAGEAKLIEWP